MRFKGLDLNLLGALDVLLQTRSVSVAAKKMNLSQPAMSAALTRLRDFFHDDLLVLEGKRMYPTAFADALHPQVRECLQSIEGLIVSSSEFVPATTRRHFRILVSDYVITAIISRLIATLAVEAPGLRLELTLPTDTAEAEIRDGRADLYVAPEQFMISDYPSELFFEERHVVVGWAANPVFDRPLDAEAIRSCGQIAVRIGGNRALSFADRQLSVMGIERNIDIETSSFTTIPWLLIGTGRLAFMHERLVRSMAEHLPLRWAPIPFEFPVMREMIQYHHSRKNDEGLAWLRGKLRGLATDPNFGS